MILMGVTVAHAVRSTCRHCKNTRVIFPDVNLDIFSNSLSSNGNSSSSEAPNLLRLQLETCFPLDVFHDMQPCVH